MRAQACFFALVAISTACTLVVDAETDKALLESLQIRLAAALSANSKLSSENSKLSSDNSKLCSELSELSSDNSELSSECRAAKFAGGSYGQRMPLIGEVQTLLEVSSSTSSSSTSSSSNAATEDGLIIPVGCEKGQTGDCWAQYQNVTCSPYASGEEATLHETKEDAKIACAKYDTCEGIAQRGPGNVDWRKWALCSDPRQDWTVTTGAVVYARQGPLNSAKCAGPEQDHRQVTGTLDCRPSQSDMENRDPTRTTGETFSQSPTDCLDNLSSGKALVMSDFGMFKCREFNSSDALQQLSVTVQTEDKKFIQRKDCTNVKRRGCMSATQVAAATGVSTKIAIVHPNKASRNVGVIAMKRTRCSGGRCDVFKNAHCFQGSDAAHLLNGTDTDGKKRFFHNVHEHEATEDELKTFYQFVVGEGAFEGVFDNPGQHYAKVKDDYRCKGKREGKEDLEKAKEFISIF